MSLEKQIKDIQRKIMLLGILDTPGMLMLALWASSYFDPASEPIHPLLKNPVVLNGMLWGGLLIMGACAIQIIRLAQKRVALERQLRESQQ